MEEAVAEAGWWVTAGDRAGSGASHHCGTYQRFFRSNPFWGRGGREKQLPPRVFPLAGFLEEFGCFIRVARWLLPQTAQSDDRFTACQLDSRVESAHFD